MKGFAPSKFFPPVEMADEDGLLAVGGELGTAWLLDAYAHGIFPWPILDGLLAWWSPDPRAVIELDQLHVSRRLARTVRSGRFAVTCDQDFRGVILGCATVGDRLGHTWLTDDMQEAYYKLHELGIAHSIEVWQEGRLAGGIYGVALGGAFSGESMFYLVRDASKVALVHLVAHLAARGFELFDIQQLTPHTMRLGATAMPRRLFLNRLAKALRSPANFGDRLEPFCHPNS